jgi:NAD dependent epimerase/dehydratase family enzyme
VRIAVSGASGFVGSALVPTLEAAGHDVTRLIRGRPAGPGEVAWDPASGAVDAGALAGTDAAVHLSGATIGRRWSSSRKAEILDSRVRSTRLLAETHVVSWHVAPPEHFQPRFPDAAGHQLFATASQGGVLR